MASDDEVSSVLARGPQARQPDRAQAVRATAADQRALVRVHPGQAGGAHAATTAPAPPEAPAGAQPEADRAAQHQPDAVPLVQQPVEPVASEQGSDAVEDPAALLEASLRARGLRMADVLLRVLAEPIPRPAPQPAPAVVAAAPPSRPLISTFLQMRPPEFRGDSGDPLRAEQFLVEAEPVFV